MTYLRTYAVLALLAMSALISVYVLLPGAREQLYEEDQLVENATVMIYLSVVACAAVGCFYVKGRYNKLVMLLFLVLGLLTSLEEMSYGERYFGFSAPYILDYKMDTVHDFFFLFFKVIKDMAEHFGFVVYVAFAAFAGLGLYVLYRSRGRILPAAKSLLRRPPFFYIFLFICLGLAALLVDLGIFKYDLLKAVEEGLEMSAALALAFGCVVAFRCQGDH